MARISRSGQRLQAGRPAIVQRERHALVLEHQAGVRGGQAHELRGRAAEAVAAAAHARRDRPSAPRARCRAGRRPADAAARTALSMSSTERPLISASAPPAASRSSLEQRRSRPRLDAHVLRVRGDTRAACRRCRGRTPSPARTAACGASSCAPQADRPWRALCAAPATRRRLRMRAASSSMRPAQR